VVKKKGKGKPPTPFYALLAIIALVGLGAIGYLASRPSGQATTVDPNLPPAEAEGYVLGRPDAPVKVVEFADFECPACSQFATVTEPDVKKRLIDAGIVRYTFYDYPLAMHRNTWHASHAAACADEQGKFWEMHDQLFNGQDKWSGVVTSRPKGIFEDYARAIGLDVAKWEQCFDSRKYQRRIEANEREAVRAKAPSTPTFIIGNKMISGAISYDTFKAYVDSALALVPRDSLPAAADARGDTATGATRR
jgi:protein-disulfide isomerase